MSLRTIQDAEMLKILYGIFLELYPGAYLGGDLDDKKTTLAGNFVQFARVFEKKIRSYKKIQNSTLEKFLSTPLTLPNT